jgi:acyl-CoA synthetase (AMP-forming)/AMP-acid ligase II
MGLHGTRVHPRPALPGLFAALLATEPNLPALVQNGHTTTFGDWWADSSLIASGLAELGVGRRYMVVLMLLSGQEFASCYLAALRLGAIVSAINPRLGPTETEHILARCGLTRTSAEHLTGQRRSDVQRYQFQATVDWPTSTMASS